MSQKRRQYSLVEVLRGPFDVSANERHTAIPLAIVLHFVPATLSLVPSLGFRNLWSFMLLIMLVVMLFGLLYPRRNSAVFSVMTYVSALWLAGSIWIAQAFWVAITGRLPHRGVPAGFVPRSTAISIGAFGLGSWMLAAAILLWHRRRNLVRPVGHGNQ
jgi:hypothetical protein